MSEVEKENNLNQENEQTNETSPSNQVVSPQPQVIVQQAVIKGSMLGGVLLVLFVIGAVLVYLVMGVAGWDNTAVRIIGAMCVGPLLGLTAFGAWVLTQRGKIRL